MLPEPTHPRPPSPRAGSALILVLWCVLLLGMAVFGVVELVELSIEHTSHEALAADARALALSGLALGLHPQLLKDDPLLFQKISGNRQFKVSIESEGSRLNVNYVLLSNHREILQNLFTQWGLKVADADHVADCLYDWVTPGDLKSLAGAKAADYAQAGLPQRPTYQAFQSLDEMREVIGMDLVEKANPNWQDSFTVWSSGPLNVNEAPPQLIAAVFSVDPKHVSYVTDQRNGKDGIPGTSDDNTIANMAALQSDLGLSDDQVKELAPLIAFNDPNRRIESVGQAGGIQVMISVVTKLNSSPIQYFLWSEQ